VESGLKWLDDIVVPGLRKGSGDCEWKIEVHGNEADAPSETEDDEDGMPVSPGPAVYIITKGPRRQKEEEESKREDDLLPTIPLRFFSY
jgi:hypothetical protein